MSTDEWLAVVIGFFIGVAVCVKLISWLIVEAGKLFMRWVMGHM